MRGRSLIVAIALAAACASNPDPRRMSLRTAETNSRGSWIVIRTKAGLEVSGELIAIDPSYTHVLAVSAGAPRLVYTPTADIASAVLYRYQHDGGFGAWGGLGALSTLSHGFWLVFSAPIWLISSGITSAVESHHVVDHYPADVKLEDLVPWARFPQGMPPGIDEQSLLFGRRPEPPAPPPPPPIPPPPPPPITPVDAGVDAP